MTASESHFSLTQLSELSGVSPRNIRFYTQLGLVDTGPSASGAAPTTTTGILSGCCGSNT